jgi:hypothetical protein
MPRNKTSICKPIKLTQRKGVEAFWTEHSRRLDNVIKLEDYKREDVTSNRLTK